MNFKMVKRGVMVALATLVLANPMPASAQRTNALDQKTNPKARTELRICALAKKTPTQTHTSQHTPHILINGKVSNNKNKLNLDSNENYITLKGKYKNCSLKTNSKKVKIRYWGNLDKNKEWEVVTKKPGKVMLHVKRKGKTVKRFTIIVKTPKLKVIDSDDSCINLELKGVGNRDSETVHNVKWYFTPVSSYSCNEGVVKDSDNCSQVFLTTPGIYKVKAKLNGKVYRMKKSVTLLSFKGDFNVMSFEDTKRVLPSYVVESLKQHHYTFSIVGKKALDHFSQDLSAEHTVSGIHDLDNRRIVVSDTSAVVVLHEIGHFVSCSFQKVKGENLTQTKEWKEIYNSEKGKFVSKTGFEEVKEIYAATSPNEFFAECFQQYYLAPSTLAKNCPKAYSFVQRTMIRDFIQIAGTLW